MTQLTAEAWCARPDQQGGPCGWRVSGSAVDVEREGRRHVGDGLKGGPVPGHATTTSQRPAT